MSTAPGPDKYCFAGILSFDPLVILTSSAPDLPLGMADPLGPTLANISTKILVTNSWSLEAPAIVARRIAAAQGYEQVYPKHKIYFVCNADTETSLFLAGNWPAMTGNHNIFVDENIFRPLEGVRPLYDAIYNARLVEWKRHELAVELPTLLLVYYHAQSSDGTVAEFHARHARYRAMLPRAVFANELTKTGCLKLNKQELNQAMALSHVGLCLSAREGAMLASMEYMMAGLPVVSTKSVGGRDLFFDDEYCAIVPDNPRAVRDATAGLIARNIPRSYVRKRTLEKVSRERMRFATFVQTLIDPKADAEAFLAVLLSQITANNIRRWRSANALANEIAANLKPVDPG